MKGIIKADITRLLNAKDEDKFDILMSIDHEKVCFSASEWHNMIKDLREENSKLKFQVNELEKRRDTYKQLWDESENKLKYFGAKRSTLEIHYLREVEDKNQYGFHPIYEDEDEEDNTEYEDVFVTEEVLKYSYSESEGLSIITTEGEEVEYESENLLKIVNRTTGKTILDNEEEDNKKEGD